MEGKENNQKCFSSSQNRHDIASMDTARFKECCHYMLTYGSHSAIVGFYSNHQCWKEACLFILKNVSSIVHTYRNLLYFRVEKFLSGFGMNHMKIVYTVVVSTQWSCENEKFAN